MATIAPEEPDKKKVSAKIRVRRRITGKNGPGGPAGSFKGSSSRNIGSAGQTVVPSRDNRAVDPANAIQPDFMNDQGGVGDDAYGPALPTNNEGGYGDDAYGPQLPEIDDKDASNSAENSPNDPQNNWAPPTGKPQDPNQSPDIANAEKNASPSDGQDTSGNLNREGFANDPDKGAWANATEQARRNTDIKKHNSRFRGKKGILGFIGAIGVTLAIATAIISIPQLALRNMQDKLVSGFTDRAKFLVEKRVEKFTNYYITKKVVATINQDNCGTVLKRGCSKVDPTKGIFSSTINKWNQNRIETKIFQKYGLDVESVPRSGEYRILQNGRVIGEGRERGMARALSTVLSDNIKFESKWEEVLLRRHMRSVMSFHGANKFCFFACFLRDDLEGKKIGSKKKLQLVLVSRIVEPANARVGAYLFCFVTSCKPEELQRETNAAAKAVYDNASERFRQIADEIGPDRVGQYLSKQVFEKVFKDAGEQILSKFIKGAGIISALYLVDFIDEMITKIDNNEIEKFGYNRNAVAAVEYATTLSSGIDDAIAFASAAEPGYSPSANFANVNVGTFGQTVTAGPSYSDIGGLFEIVNGYDKSRVYAAAAGTRLGQLECDDGYIIPAESSELVCPETKLKQNVLLGDLDETEGFKFVRDFVAGPYRACIPFTSICVNKIVSGGLEAIDGTVGAITGPIVSALTKFPGVESTLNSIASIASGVLESVLNKVFRLSTDVLAEDQKSFDQAAAGIDYLTNSMIKGYQDEQGQMQGMGGRLLSEEERVELEVAIAEKNAKELENKNFFAKYLDINNSSSLVAASLLRVGTILPLNGAPVSIAPPSLGSLTMPLTSLFTDEASATTNAALLRRESNFGVSQYGFSLSELETDVESTTPERCRELAVEREKEENKIVNPETGEVEYLKSNICMLDSVTDDVLTKPLELDTLNSVTTSTGTNANSNICEGYTRVNTPINTERRTYSPQIQEECREMVARCNNGSAVGTEKILCSAFEFDGTLYGNSYGSFEGDKAIPIYGFSASSGNYGISAESWLENRGQGLSPDNLLECSGLTSVALFKTYGFDGKNIGCSGNWTARQNPTLFDPLSASEIRPGDFLTYSYGCASGGGRGHVAIAASGVDSNGDIIVYETNSWKSPVRFNSYNLQETFTGGWSRYKGPGVQEAEL